MGSSVVGDQRLRDKGVQLLVEPISRAEGSRQWAKKGRERERESVLVCVCARVCSKQGLILVQYS